MRKNKDVSDLVWDLFVKTGNVNYYILQNKLKQKDK